MKSSPVNTNYAFQSENYLLMLKNNTYMLIEKNDDLKKSPLLTEIKIVF
jgi:hypothetical protein